MITTTRAPSLAAYAEAISQFSGASFLSNPDMRRLLTLSEARTRSGKLIETIYAPFEHIEHGARLVIVGITPGATQAENALVGARAALRKGMEIDAAARLAKVTASFSGNMRPNLCGMLDAVGVPGWLGIKESIDLFKNASHLVHFTSALQNPVFVGGANYNGSPDILGHARLVATIEDTLAAEVRALPNAWWLPLWDVPAAALSHLVKRGLLPAQKLLPAMPHPAGGNGENIAWFRGTTKATTFSSRRASTGELLLRRRDELRTFFSNRQV